MTAPEPIAPDPISLPASPDGWMEWLEERGRGSLRTAGDQVAALKEAEPADAAILQVWNDAAIALANAFAVTSLMSSVHPDPEVIATAETIEAEARRFSSDLHLDKDVFDQLSSAGRTIVIITHEPEVAARAKRLIRLVDGQIVEDNRQSPLHLPPVGAFAGRHAV